MNFNKMILGTLLLVIISSCKKDDDSVFEEITAPVNDIVGSIWVNSGNNFSELNLKDGQEINALTTLDSYRCTEFDGTYICIQGEHNGSKTIQRKGTFNGELIWSKEYVGTAETYYRLNSAEVHQNKVFISYEIINTTSFDKTYHIEALNLDTADTLWSIELGDNIKRLVSLGGKIIAELSVGSSTKELVSINTNNGSIDHSLPFNERIGKLIGGTSSIFVMTWNKSVIAMDNELNFNWTFDTDGANILGGIETENQLLLYSRDKTVYSLDKNTGILAWKSTYSDHSPLAINTVNDKVYVINRKESQTDILVKTLDLFSGEELDSYTYETNEELNSSYTDFYIFDQNLLIFNSDDNQGNANIALIHITGKSLLWEKQLNQISYPHFIITPSGIFQ